MQSTPRDCAARFIEAVLNGSIQSRNSRRLMLIPQIQIFSKHEFPSFSTETTTQNESIHLSYGVGWGLYWLPFGEAFFKEGHG